jgi:membrane-bound serine protease (ClpP class)
MGKKRLWRVVLLLLAATLLQWVTPVAANDSLAVVIPIKGEIEPGLASVVRRGIRQAEEQGADVIILDIATPGGRVDAALEIGDLLRNTTIPVVAYVSGRAWSAGAYIALSADEIAMIPGSSIGAAETNPDTPKVISAWRGEMESVAERNGRDPQIAAAMVEKDLAIEGLVAQGEILTLTATKALELDYAEYSVVSLEDLLAQLDLAGATVNQVEATWIERVARAVTSPSIAPIFLVIGFVGLTMEFFLPGWGVAGFLGIASLALFFGGHMLAGLAGWEALISFMVGVLLLFIEAFVTPGFGVAGIAGIVLVFTGIYFTSGDAVQAIRTIMLSFFGAVAVTGVMLRFFKDSSVWNRLILRDSMNREAGYISTHEQVDLIGKKGLTITMLRPAGIAEIEGIRLDVVSEGGFLPAGQMIRVAKVEGSRIIVQLAMDE